MNASKFCALFALVLLATGSRAQIPAIRTQNCGALLSSVISVCSHPTLSRPDWCCNELKKWNDARCWCEANAFDALDKIAGNEYAFSFRDGFCGGVFQRPARGKITPEQATCEPFESVAETDPMEQCSTPPAELRAQRYATLDALRDDKVADAADLSPWFLRMDALYTDDATFELVGLFLGHGRFEVKQYYMTRQEAYGFEPATADTTSEHFWRAPNIVSYTGSSTTSTGSYGKHEFVTFEPCSPRIAEVYTVEDNYQTRYAQFWDARQTRLMTRYEQTPASWCQQVSERCVGEDFPFESVPVCVAFYTTLQAEGRITCNKFEQSYVPQYAMHGDTIACRSFYLDLAVVESKGACPAVGREPNQGRCEATQCPGNAYIDPFARDASAPQYDSVPSFACSVTSCTENWPSEEQIRMIPVGEWTPEPTPAAAPEVAPAPAPVVTPTPVPAAAGELDPVLAADEDENIDEQFENTNIPPAAAPAEPDMMFVSQPLNT